MRENQPLASAVGRSSPRPSRKTHRAACLIHTDKHRQHGIVRVAQGQGLARRRFRVPSRHQEGDRRLRALVRAHSHPSARAPEVVNPPAARLCGNRLTLKAAMRRSAARPPRYPCRRPYGTSTHAALTSIPLPDTTLSMTTTGSTSPGN